MRITIEKLKELRACEPGIELFPRFPGLSASGSADVGELCRWAVREGHAPYAWWLLPRLMGPVVASEWAIRCARTVFRDDASWLAWADGWLTGEDRSGKSAWKARAVASHAAAAEAAGWAWEAAGFAAEAAGFAAEAAAAEAAGFAAEAAAAAAAEFAAAWAWEAAAEFAAAWAWEAAGFAAEAADEMIGLAIQIIDREKGV